MGYPPTPPPIDGGIQEEARTAANEMLRDEKVKALTTLYYERAKLQEQMDKKDEEIAEFLRNLPFYNFHEDVEPTQGEDGR
jgi:hypothetical protein